jgi:class 3 adenylate cyclase
VPAFRNNEIDWDALPKLTAELSKISAWCLEATAASFLKPSPHLALRCLPSLRLRHPANAQAQADAQRRHLTVMLCDLVGSTALSARLDSEDLREVVGAYHRAVAEIVAGFDGFVAKHMGDGVIVYFG